LIGSIRRRFLEVLFVTQMDDFVRVGGLAAVSAALPRALRSWSEVRIILPDEGPPRLHAPQRDVAIVHLGAFGSLLLRALSESGVALSFHSAAANNSICS
jgi:glycosyl transferase family 5 (putative starch synthase catalytic subunit)